MTAPHDPSGDLLPSRPVRLLDEDGTLHEDPGHPVDLTDDELCGLYRHMLVTRRLDHEAGRLEREGRLSGHAASTGREAAQVGSGAATAPGDWIFPCAHEVGAAVVRGMPATELFHLFGAAPAGRVADPGRFGLVVLPAATRALQATGFAMAATFEDRSLVAMAYLDAGAARDGPARDGPAPDGPASQGAGAATAPPSDAVAMSERDRRGALAVAGAAGAPVVFVLQNDRPADTAPGASRRGPTSLPDLGEGVPGVRCDGHDVLGTYAVTRRAVERARGGGGPTVIEAVLDGYGPHGPAPVDPLDRMRRFLARQGLLDGAVEEQLHREVDGLALAARETLGGDPDDSGAPAP